MKFLETYISSTRPKQHGNSSYIFKWHWGWIDWRPSTSRTNLQFRKFERLN